MFGLSKKQCICLQLGNRKVYLYLSKYTNFFYEKRSVQYPYSRFENDEKYEITEEEKIVVITNATIPKYFIHHNESIAFDYTQKPLKHDYQELTFRKEYQVITLLYRLEELGVWKMVQKEMPSSGKEILFPPLFSHYINPTGWKMGYNIVVSLFEFFYHVYQERKNKNIKKESD